MTTHNLSQEEMETFQRLSDQYQPDVEGPLVGEKRPMTVLMEEYAQADPTYRAKTTSLLATHSEYRRIKGDGQCGWRGTVFGYFETLLQIGDANMVEVEFARIRSFDDTMRMAGYDCDIIADLFDFTWELFDKLLQAVKTHSKDESFLMESFNDEMGSNSIIYHFKLMTSAFMALRPDAYEPFLEISLAEYRSSRIDPSNQEIDQIGLQALVDGVIAPAGMAVEVSYLDRSQGDTVTPHQFVQDAPNWPVIRLLYRPGHYDMIYKNVQPVRAFSLFGMPDYTHTLAATGFDDQNMDPYTYIQSVPGSHPHRVQRGLSDGSYPPDGLHHLAYGTAQYQDPTYYRQGYDSYHVAPASMNEQETWLPSPQDDISAGPTPVSQPAPRQSPILSNPNSARSPPEPQFRMAQVYFDYERRRQESIPLETGPLREVPDSPEYFRSPDFQPHIYNPREDYP